MKYFRKLERTAERLYLRTQITLARPDLAGAPFLRLIRTYSMEAIEEHIKAEAAYQDSLASLEDALAVSLKEPRLPRLVERALAYEATESIGHYRAQALLHEQLNWNLRMENMEQGCRINELMLENIKARNVAHDALQLATNSIGPQVRQN